MPTDQYHEPPDELSPQTRTFARMCASLSEEAEAIGWYEQRLSVEPDESARSIMLDSLGEDDSALEHVEIRESIKPLLEALPPREKKILLLRFFGGMTQSQIAAEIGVSQMHVSRLLSRTLEKLRNGLESG